MKYCPTFFNRIRNFYIKLSLLSKILLLAGTALLSIWTILFIAVPSPLFDEPCSTVMYSAGGNLMGARIATDGQWRFPQLERVPEKFATCLIQFEDKRFRYHPGIDPAAVARAVKQNLSKKGTRSGGSTITMQLARIARGNRDRNIYEKSIESLWALYFETRYSKNRILSLYASNAPFGGNVVGLETAAWRYFGRSAEDLSWAESATLAVLPNSPALIHPGRNRDVLKAKRDGLLRKLYNKGIIDRDEFELGCLEPLPSAPVPLPDKAPHLLERLAVSGRGTAIHTSIDNGLQERAQGILNRFAARYTHNHVQNAAALIADVRTGEILAYCGNVTTPAEERHGRSVDIITSERSTGSILKPILYAGMLNDGLILPNTLISDTPLNIDGFAPQNFNRAFHGAVPASRAVERSLNVPLVRMLSLYNTGRFMTLMRSLGMTTLHHPETHYGASVILGGAEGTLWDICGIYASLGRTLGNYRAHNGKYKDSDIRPLTPYPRSPEEPVRNVLDKRLTDDHILDHASLWFMLEAMSSLNRPEEEADWQQFASMKKIGWKTGTSFGGRDAWAIGLTPEYIVGVWIGNASGEGRSGVTGVGYAAPVLFDLFSLLPSTTWFSSPYDEMIETAVCRKSGHKASTVCEHVDTVFIPASGVNTPLCPYHRLVHLDQEERFRVNSSCESVDRIVTRPWFVLPPAQEYFYRNYNPDYTPLPPFKPGCESAEARLIELIYPEHDAILYLPRGFTGEKEKFIFRAAHARPGATIYWHLDGDYLGESSGEHAMACDAKEGTHILTLTDTWGNQRKIRFEVKS